MIVAIHNLLVYEDVIMIPSIFYPFPRASSLLPYNLLPRHLWRSARQLLLQVPSLELTLGAYYRADFVVPVYSLVFLVPKKPSVAVEFVEPAAEVAAAVAVDTAALLVAESEAAAGGGTAAESFPDTPCIDPVALASHSLVLELPAFSDTPCIDPVASHSLVLELAAFSRVSADF